MGKLGRWWMYTLVNGCFGQIGNTIVEISSEITCPGSGKSAPLNYQTPGPVTRQCCSAHDTAYKAGIEHTLNVDWYQSPGLFFFNNRVWNE